MSKATTAYARGNTGGPLGAEGQVLGEKAASPNAPRTLPAEAPTRLNGFVGPRRAKLAFAKLTNVYSARGNKSTALEE